ncbi:MAG: NAD(P)H-dependent glycerol-3-phosphate dehydrogenase [Cyanobacteria bacterium RI_101]|nr:NAD(P)H-dependent glycerol-3-phosphate dehydrogenase [Cyanobacteria bacterium RI_101]
MSSLSQPVTLLGAGRWGTALGGLLAENSHRLQYWSRSGAITLKEAIQDARVIVSALSMKGVPPTLAQLQSLDLAPDCVIISATKGLDPQSQKTPSQLWRQAFPQLSVVALSGPNLSKEIEGGLPTATVAASQDPAASRLVQTLFASERFRVYVNPDPLGAELGGALKNVMAIAAGVCDGLQLGANAKAALLTRALPEMARLGAALGAREETFFGLSGLGDLLATCNSPLSRNYQVGFKLAQGLSLEQILAESEGVAEGVPTAGVAVRLAQTLNLSLPISQQVYALLQGAVTPPTALKNLMGRELTAEFENMLEAPD